MSQYDQIIHNITNLQDKLGQEEKKLFEYLNMEREGALKPIKQSN